MASQSDIEWTEATWNPVAGCAMVSPGCTNCYAQRMAARLEAMGVQKYSGTTRKSGGRAVWTGHVAFDEKAMHAPLSWKKPLRIFVNSMSDLFQQPVPVSVIRDIWDVMTSTPKHTYQILTKRPERMQSVLSEEGFPVLKNVWLGTSIESQEFIDRIDVLRRTPAHVRFISFEPLLGPIADIDLSDIHWAIVGGESGPKARPIDPRWVAEIRDLCAEQNVAFFFKQWGGTRKKSTGRILHGRTWDEYPSTASVTI